VFYSHDRPGGDQQSGDHPRPAVAAHHNHHPAAAAVDAVAIIMKTTNVTTTAAPEMSTALPPLNT